MSSPGCTLPSLYLRGVLILRPARTTPETLGSLIHARSKGGCYMKVRYVAVAVAAALAIGAAPAAASTASPDTLNVTAVVLDQMCVGPGGDFVRVTLSGTGNS